MQVDVGEDVVVRGERIWNELSRVRSAFHKCLQSSLLLQRESFR